MLRNIISKPVLATVISILLVILGSLALNKLPLQQFPDIAPPSVVVTANYPGANAETIIRSVAPSLEEAINGVENISYMSSIASNDGTLTITVYFKLGTNPDQAAVNVQNRVSQATSQLPPEVVQQGVITNKQENSIIMATGIYTLDEKKYDETFLNNYALINLIPEIKRIPGVGAAQIFGGGKDYSMRVWLNPAKMETYHITPVEINAAIQDKSLEAAPGRMGDRSPEVFEYVLKYKGKLNKPEDYENIILRANADGSVLRLKDVARVELGSFIYSDAQRLNGRTGVAIVILQLPGSNSNQVQIAVNEFMKRASKDFPKGIEFKTFYSTKRSLDASIAQVKRTFLEAFSLVFLVVLVFLQDFRSTLIPAIAVPVAIMGTFFFMSVFGFTINLLTLFALVLAIGIVVDDAIVVVEAVHRKMEQNKGTPQQATIEAMREITGAIISITFVMAAVFLPVGLMEGSTGLFYRQFAFTMAIAIVISAVNALTLTPALAALFLRNRHDDEHKENYDRSFSKKFFTGFNAGFGSVTRRYGETIRFLIKRKWIALAGLVAVIVGCVWMVKHTQTGFIPTEDQNFIAIAASMPSGTSLERTKDIMREAESKLKQLEFQDFVINITGYNLLTTSTSPSAGIFFIILRDPNKRGKVSEINKLIGVVQQTMNTIRGGLFFAFSFPTVPGFSNVEALDVILQDRTNGPLDKFSTLSGDFIRELNKQPEIALAFTTFKADYPQYEIQVDEDKVGQLGLSVRDILQTVGAYYGTSQASDFNRFGKYYKVVLQAEANQKNDPNTLSKIYVKNRLGNMVPVSSVVTLKRVYGSETASRYNLFNSIELNVIPKPGHSSGEVIDIIRKLGDSKLPSGFRYEFTGQTKEEIQSAGQSVFVFILCVVFVYFLLAAQYESYILPLAVIFSIPTGVLSVFVAISTKGIENNIYVQVALVMLIGLLAKNAILIVEFALQRRRAGMTLTEAAIEAAKLRLRPIIMTSFAFVFGLFPMSIAVGPSAQGNHSISYAAAGGMIGGVFLGLLLIPVLFVIFQYLQERVTSKKIVVAQAPAMTLVLVVGLAMLTSCHAARAISTPETTLPAQYTGASADTVTIANLPWRNYLADTALRPLIEAALANNHDLQAAIRNVDAAGLRVRQAKLLDLPAANVQVGVSSQNPSDNSLNGITFNDFLHKDHLEDYTVAASISWEADIWGKIRSQKAATLASYLQTAEARNAVQTRLISDVAKGYYNLLLLDEELRIAERNARLADTTLLIVRLQYQVGKVTNLAVQQVAAQRLAALRLIPQFRQAIGIQEDALNVLTGKMPAQIVRPDGIPDDGGAQPDAVGVPAQLLAWRPEIRMAEQAVYHANAEIGYARASMYPSLVITAQGGVDAFQASDWFKIPSSLFGLVAGTIIQPLFNQNRLRTAYEVAKVKREESVIRFRQAVLVGVSEVTDQLVKIARLREQLDYMAGRTDTLREAADNANALFRSGLATYLEVVTAESAVLDSELETAAIRKAQLDARVDLYRAVGGGWR